MMNMLNRMILPGFLAAIVFMTHESHAQQTGRLENASCRVQIKIPVDDPLYGSPTRLVNQVFSFQHSGYSFHINGIIRCETGAEFQELNFQQVKVVFGFRPAGMAAAMQERMKEASKACLAMATLAASNSRKYLFAFTAATATYHLYPDQLSIAFDSQAAGDLHCGIAPNTFGE